MKVSMKIIVNLMQAGQGGIAWFAQLSQPTLPLLSYDSPIYKLLLDTQCPHIPDGSVTIVTTTLARTLSNQNSQAVTIIVAQENLLRIYNLCYRHCIDAMFSDFRLGHKCHNVSVDAVDVDIPVVIYGGAFWVFGERMGLDSVTMGDDVVWRASSNWFADFYTFIYNRLLDISKTSHNGCYLQLLNPPPPNRVVVVQLPLPLITWDDAHNHKHVRSMLGICAPIQGLREAKLVVSDQFKAFVNTHPTICDRSTLSRELLVQQGIEPNPGPPKKAPVVHKKQRKQHGREQELRENLLDQIEASRALEKSLAIKKEELESRKKKEDKKDGPLFAEMAPDFFHTGWERCPTRSKTAYWKKILVIIWMITCLVVWVNLSCLDPTVCSVASDHFGLVSIAFTLLVFYVLVGCFNGTDYDTQHPDHIESNWIEAPYTSRIENWLWPPKKVSKVREYFHTLHEYIPPFSLDEDARPQNFQRGECKVAAHYRRYVCTKLDFGTDEVITSVRVISLELVSQLKNKADDGHSDLSVVRERIRRNINSLSGISIDRSLGLTADDVFEDTVDYMMALIVRRRERLGGNFSYGVGN